MLLQQGRAHCCNDSQPPRLQRLPRGLSISWRRHCRAGLPKAETPGYLPADHPLAAKCIVAFFPDIGKGQYLPSQCPGFVHDGAPDMAGFPPAVIGLVAPETQQQRDHCAQQGWYGHRYRDGQHAVVKLMQQGMMRVV